MILSVKQVIPKDNHIIQLTFSNGEIREFDLKPYLDFGIFRELRDVRVFNTVKVSFDTVVWENQADLDPEMLFLKSTPINS